MVTVLDDQASLWTSAQTVGTRDEKEVPKPRGCAALGSHLEGAPLCHNKFSYAKGGKAKGKGKKETAKVGMTVNAGQSERDGEKVKVGTHQVKVGSNQGQQESTIWNVTRSSMMFS